MKELTEISMVFLGPLGKLISHSKSRYRENFPKNLVIFNSNVCAGAEKVWWGDLDVTESKENLSSLALALNSNIYVLREMDGRFENEETPLIEEFVVKFCPDGSIIRGRFYGDFVL